MGLGLDSLRSSHPVEVPIESASQVNEIFDAISYSKGSCVIRMLESHLGEETFRAGMRIYVARHQYANAGTTDLWAALSEASGEDVRGLMECWTSQTGYPILSVASKDDGSSVVVSQRRYLASGPDSLTPEESGATWKVPLRAEGFATVPGVLDAATGAFDVAAADREKPLKLNVGQSGFYRVVYDENARARLMRALPGMSEVDRVGLVSDAFACGAAGYAKTTAALELARAYADAGEESYVVWCVLTLVPIRPRRRGERRSLRTFPVVSLRPGSLAFNLRPRRLSTPLRTPFNSTPTGTRSRAGSAG
jgi:aminopeptidase N